MVFSWQNRGSGRDQDQPHVDIWFLDFSAAPAEWEEDCLRLFDRRERERYVGFKSAGKRSEYAYSHALTRLALGAASGADPGELRIEAMPWGKPRVSSPACAGMDFSLTHASGRAAVAVARGAEVGLDLEGWSRPLDLDGIAREFFSNREIAVLNALPPPIRRKRFFAIWTLKEAQLKATGIGLSGIDKAFSFHAESAGEVPGNAACEVDPEGRKWWFRQYEPGGPEDALLLSLAVRYSFRCLPKASFREITRDRFGEWLGSSKGPQGNASGNQPENHPSETRETT